MKVIENSSIPKLQDIYVSDGERYVCSVCKAQGPTAHKSFNWKLPDNTPAELKKAIGERICIGVISCCERCQALPPSVVAFAFAHRVCQGRVPDWLDLVLQILEVDAKVVPRKRI